jgi:hypothetical protein
MSPKVYAMVLSLVALAAALFHFTGNLTDVALHIFAFIGATLFAALFLAVLPWWLTRKYTWIY